MRVALGYLVFEICGGMVKRFDPTFKVDGRPDGSRNGYIGTHNDSTTFATNITSLASGEGFIETRGPNGNDNVSLTTLQNHPNHGFISVENEEGETKAAMYVNSGGEGIIFADQVNNIIENPNKSGEQYLFSTIQGPEHVFFLRGTAQLENGISNIEFPSYFRELIAQKGMTVMMTPLSASSKGLCVTQKNTSGFQVQELLEGNGNYEFDWEIKAIRKKSLHKSSDIKQIPVGSKPRKQALSPDGNIE